MVDWGKEFDKKFEVFEDLKFDVEDNNGVHEEYIFVAIKAFIRTLLEESETESRRRKRMEIKEVKAKCADELEEYFRDDSAVRLDNLIKKWRVSEETQP